MIILRDWVINYCLVTKLSDSFATPWTVPFQDPLSMGFPRQEYWSGLPLPSPGDLPDPEIEPVFPELAGRFFTTELPGKPKLLIHFSSVQFSRSVVSDSLRPHELQHTRPPCPSPTPEVHPNPCPLSQRCHPTISSSVIPFSSCPQSLPSIKILFYIFWIFGNKYADFGLPWWLRGKDSACNAGNVDSTPWSGRSPGEDNGNPLQYSCLGSSMDRGAWWAIVYPITKTWTWLSG